MPPGLLESQLATLEEPGDDENAWVIDVDQPPGQITETIVGMLRGSARQTVSPNEA